MSIPRDLAGLAIRDLVGGRELLQRSNNDQNRTNSSSPLCYDDLLLSDPSENNYPEPNNPGHNYQAHNYPGNNYPGLINPDPNYPEYSPHRAQDQASLFPPCDVSIN